MIELLFIDADVVLEMFDVDVMKKVVVNKDPWLVFVEMWFTVLVFVEDEVLDKLVDRYELVVLFVKPVKSDDKAIDVFFVDVESIEVVVKEYNVVEDVDIIMIEGVDLEDVMVDVREVVKVVVVEDLKTVVVEVIVDLLRIDVETWLVDVVLLKYVVNAELVAVEVPFVVKTAVIIVKDGNVLEVVGVEVMVIEAVVVVVDGVLVVVGNVDIVVEVVVVVVI